MNIRMERSRRLRGRMRTWWLGVALAGVSLALVVPSVTLRGAPSQAGSGSLCPRASNYVVKVLKQRIVDFNHGHAWAAARFYARRGVLVELDAAPDTKGAGVFKGRAAIAKRIKWLHDAGLRLRPMGCPVQLGVEVAAPTGLYVPLPGSDYTYKHPAHDILVFEFNKYGRIDYEWVTGGKGFAH